LDHPDIEFFCDNGVFDEGGVLGLGDLANLIGADVRVNLFGEALSEQVDEGTGAPPFGDF